ncbi:MAG: lipid-A-disaccharide synthase [Gemmataceae bacterium]
MQLFISAGEPSGDLHGANLIRHLRARRPDLRFTGLGGPRMQDAGCEIVYPLTDLAVVGLFPVLASLHKFHHALGLARAAFKRDRPDALVMIDFPGFHWWLAGCARKHGIPVSYFVPPQIWSWATWRAAKMRRLCDQVLATLPFEDAWFRERGIPSRYIGHPYFDEIARQRLDPAFLAEQRAKPGPVVGILPGSRNSEIRNNLDSLIAGAKIVHARRPDVRFLVAAFKPSQADTVRDRLKGSGLPAEVHQGRTPEVIELAHSLMSVSGSVSLEILARDKPAVMAYRLPWITLAVARLLMRAKYITLVNLLADRLLLPEAYGSHCLGPAMAEHVLHWLNDDAAYRALRGELAALRAVVMEPGACERASAAVLELIRAA